MTQSANEQLGATLRNARRVRHLTLLDLKNTTGVPVAYMSDVERGKDPLEHLKNWAAALGYRVNVELEAIK